MSHVGVELSLSFRGLNPSLELYSVPLYFAPKLRERRSGGGKDPDAVHTWLSRVMPSQESVSPSGDELPRQAVLGFLPPLTPC